MRVSVLPAASVSFLILALPALHVPLAAAAPAATAPATPRASLAVTTTQARLQSWPLTVAASGSVVPWMEATIGARVTGLPLIEVRVNVGDRVRKGQLLARFDDRTVRAEEDLQKAALAQAEAAAAQADANRDRAQSIQDSGAISAQDVLQYVTAAATAKAQVAQARAQLLSTQLRLSFTDVVAPDDGIISARGATIGSVSQAAGGGSELFRLIRQGRLEWRPELTAAQLAQVRPGMLATLQLPDATPVQGRVRQLSPALDSTTRLGLAFVDLPAGAHALPAMYLNGHLQLGLQPAITVPYESIVIRDGRTYVVQLDSQRCRLVLVNTGRRVGDEVEVTSGLAVGTVVVVKGAGFLNDNDVVQVIAAKTAPARLSLPAALPARPLAAAKLSTTLSALSTATPPAQPGATRKLRSAP